MWKAFLSKNMKLSPVLIAIALLVSILLMQLTNSVVYDLYIILCLTFATILTIMSIFIKIEFPNYVLISILLMLSLTLSLWAKLGFNFFFLPDSYREYVTAYMIIKEGHLELGGNTALINVTHDFQHPAMYTLHTRSYPLLSILTAIFKIVASIKLVHSAILITISYGTIALIFNILIIKTLLKNSKKDVCRSAYMMLIGVLLPNFIYVATYFYNEWYTLAVFYYPILHLLIKVLYDERDVRSSENILHSLLLLSALIPLATSVVTFITLMTLVIALIIYVAMCTLRLVEAKKIFISFLTRSLMTTFIIFFGWNFILLGLSPILKFLASPEELSKFFRMRLNFIINSPSLTHTPQETLHFQISTLPEILLKIRTGSILFLAMISLAISTFTLIKNRSYASKISPLLAISYALTILALIEVTTRTLISPLYFALPPLLYQFYLIHYSTKRKVLVYAKETILRGLIFFLIVLYFLAPQSYYFYTTYLYSEDVKPYMVGLPNSEAIAFVNLINNIDNQYIDFLITDSWALYVLIIDYTNNEIADVSLMPLYVKRFGVSSLDRPLVLYALKNTVIMIFTDIKHPHLSTFEVYNVEGTIVKKSIDYEKSRIYDVKYPMRAYYSS